MSAGRRLFFGVPLTALAREALERIPEIVADLPRIRPVQPGNWHITLRFLGPTTEDTARRVEAALSDQHLPPAFSVRLKGWDAFPRRSSARVLWLGIEDPTNGLSHLNAAAEAAAQAGGFDPERRPYTPHLTVARFRDPADVRPVLETLPPIDEILAVDRIVLFQSQLTPAGARYEALRSFPLGG